MGIGFRAGVITTVLAAVAQMAGAQQERVIRAEMHPLGEQGAQGNVVFADGQHAFQRLKEQLDDPAQRLALRAEHRSSIEAGHPDLAAALGIDPAVEQKFFDLLADQQLERLAEFHNRPRQMPPHDQMMQTMADSQTKMMEAQRAVLGDAAMERYRDYMDTLAARLQVSQFDARLTGRDKLQPEQKTRLIALMHQHDPLRATAPRPPRSYSLELAAASPGTQGLQALAPFHHVEWMEEMLKTALEKDRQLFASTAGVLTPPQQKALQEMRAEFTTRMQLRLEQARSTGAAGPEVYSSRASQLATDNVRKPVAGDIRIEVTVKVDGGKPTVVKHTGPNGQAVELEVDGIVVEATPTLYEGNWLETQLAFYEQRPNGRRRIGNGSQGGMVSQGATGSLFSGGGSTIVTGSKKAYVVATGVAAAPLQ